MSCLEKQIVVTVVLEAQDDKGQIMADMQRTKYALETARILRKGKAVKINANYTLAKANDGVSPFIVYGPMSRLSVVQLDQGPDNREVRVTGNIPMSSVADLVARTKYAFQKHMDALCAPKASGTSPAYTVKFTSGNLKGKTPIDVLAENPADGMDILNRQYKFLKDNVVKYPKNQIQINAIMDAANLRKEGKLEQAQAVHYPTVVLYDAEARALIRKPREDGKCPVYSIKITWDVGEKYPVTFETTNLYAPVIHREDGTISPILKDCDRTSIKKATLVISEEEWMNVIRQIKTNMRQFENANASDVFRDAVRADRENREAAKRSA